MVTEKGSSYNLQKSSAAQLSLFEKLGLIRVLFALFGNTFFSLITAAFRSKKRKPATLWRYIQLTRLRSIIRIAKLTQLHALIPPTHSAYEKACKNNGQEFKREVFGDGTDAFWIGPTNSEKVVLSFHGGGYSLPASTEHFEFIFQALKKFQSQGHNVAYLCLAYDLTPSALYPRQLGQAAAFLNYVLNDLHFSPENIILSGDSAGANLILSLVSHILHPHPSPSVPRVTLPSPLLGCLLICPWVSFDGNGASFKENVYKDCIDPEGSQKWIRALAGDHANGDNYNEPITARESWWKNFPAKDVLIVAGGDEYLLDGVKEFNKKFQEALKGQDVKYEFIICPNEYHDQWYIDIQMGYTKESDETKQAKVIKEFIQSRL